MNKNLKSKYPPETAGRRMVSNIPLAFPEQRILDVKKKIFEKAQEFETLNYIYVVDKENKLVGVLSLKEIFQKSEETKIEEIMIKELIKINPYTDQERVAILALKHNLKSIPVVDRENKFLGIIPSDIILEIFHSEHIEDIFHHAGIHKVDFSPAKVIRDPVGILVKARLPWLIFGLFGGILAAQITNFFETPLKSHFILAAFIPLIVYMADAVGTQTETLFIRGLAIEPKLAIKNYLFREIKIGFLIALAIGILLTLVSSLYSGLPYIGFILGVSMFLTIISAMAIAITIPWLLDRLKKDPALGAGPFGTIVCDILSLIIYFSVATLVLRVF